MKIFEIILESNLYESREAESAISRIVSLQSSITDIYVKTLNSLNKKVHDQDHGGPINQKTANWTKIIFARKWMDEFYLYNIKEDLYDLQKNARAESQELLQFLRERSTSFNEIEEELPSILLELGNRLGSEKLSSFAQNWITQAIRFERRLKALFEESKNIWGEDDPGGKAGQWRKVNSRSRYQDGRDGKTRSTEKVSTSKDAIDAQSKQVAAIIDAALSQLPPNVAERIRASVVRAKPKNRLAKLKQEFNKLGINM